MTSLEIFNNDQFGTIRTLTINEEPYFVGKDIATALGYKEPHKAITRHCRKGTKHPVSDNQGVTRQVHIIPEGDIIRLVVNSKLSTAEKFESWVFDEVIPTVIKTGGYITDEADIQTVLEKNIILKLKQPNSRPTNLIKQYIEANTMDSGDKLKVILKQLRGEHKEKAYLCIRSAYGSICEDKSIRGLSIYTEDLAMMEREYGQFKAKSISQSKSKQNILQSKQIKALQGLENQVQKLSPILIFNKELITVDDNTMNAMEGALDATCRVITDDLDTPKGVVVDLTDTKAYKSRSVYISLYTKESNPKSWSGMKFFEDSNYSLLCQITPTNHLKVWKQGA